MTEKKTIAIVLFKVGQPPVRAEIAGDLDAAQRTVGGHIQMVPSGGGLDLMCNEEGKLMGLEPNRHLVNRRLGCGDVIAGDFYVTAHDANGVPASLTDDQIEAIIRAYT